MTKVFESHGTEFICFFDNNGFSGSCSYDFDSGDFIGHRPENMDNCDWLICCRKFISICNKMIAPFLDD